MKNQTIGLLLIGVALLVVIGISLAYQTTVLPHSSCKMAHARFEGMEGSPFDGAGEESDPTDSISWLDKEDNKIAVKKEKNKENTASLKVEGFELHPASVGDFAPLDYFSSLKSGADCTPGIYSTSKGYLCLDDKAKQLLKTRGGNMLSGEAQIGV